MLAMQGFGNFNQFEGLDGNDTITGNGNTRIIYSAATSSGVTINLQGQTASGATVGNDTFVGVNSATGSNFDDTYNASGFTGVTSAGSFGTFNLFEGIGGNDTITGNGNTRISYSQSAAGVTVTLTGGAGTATGTAIGTDTFTGVNSVQGSNSIDNITGGSENEFFFGGAGADIIIANDGNDGITGQGGNDNIDGGAGTDMVTFTGGQGQYTITTPGAPGAILVQNNSGNGDGTDTLTNVEVLQFSDAIRLLSSGTAGSPIDISGQGITAAGNAVVTGTGGDDFLTIGANINGRQINLAGGTDTVTVSGTTFGTFFSLNLAGVENLKGSNDDSFVNLANTATGLIVDLGGGVDNLALAAGSNSVSIVNVESIGYGDFGPTPSNDTLTLLNNVTGVSVNMGFGDNTLNLTGGGNSLGDVSNANHIYGSATNDVLTIAGAVGSGVSGATITFDLGDGDDTLNVSTLHTPIGLVGVEHLNGTSQDNFFSLLNNTSGVAVNLGDGNDTLGLVSGLNSLSILGVEDLGVNDYLVPSDDTVTLLNEVSGVSVNLGGGTANILNLAAGSNSCRQSLERELRQR